MTEPLSRWENGSFFQWVQNHPPSSARSPWDKERVMYGSGRDAIRALVNLGRAERGWRRMWVPSYFCQCVVESIAHTGLDALLYTDGPEDTFCDSSDIDARPGDVVLRMNYFGLRTMPQSCRAKSPGVEIIDDHSHDPWSEWAWKSDADWCIASLRKSLPIPDGGVLWSPKAHELPPAIPATPEHEVASLRKFAAMALKDMYLSGHHIEKQTFRELAESGESGIVGERISGMPSWVTELVEQFPVDDWRSIRKANHQTLSRLLVDVPGIRVLQPISSTRTCPFAGIIECDSDLLRDHIRDELARRQVYATILWPMDEPALPGIPSQHLRFSRSMMTIHCDMRYTERDMRTIAGFIRELATNAPSVSTSPSLTIGG